jgi:cyclopropane-fatty-acyl-phospholipid synthase
MDTRERIGEQDDVGRPEGCLMTGTMTRAEPFTTEDAAAAAPGAPPTGLRTGASLGIDEASHARRRTALARGIIHLVREAIVDPDALAIELEGTQPDHARPCRSRAVVRDADALARLLFPPSPDAFAEGYLRGDLQLEGDVMAAVQAGEALDLRRLGPAGVRRLVRWGMELRAGTPPPRPLRRVAAVEGDRHSRARDLAAVRFHYDVGNAFFGLWLDQRLAYSCAYFPDGTTPELAAGRLDDAQEAKLDLIARKLRLAPGMRLLDIGSGWGSLISRAGERCGCDALGITLSERQATEADARVRDAGLADRVRTLVRDYRDLDGLGEFDAVASVGMFEHVGRANLPVYFAAAFQALRPGGLFLNHGIANAGPEVTRIGPDLRPTTSHFVDRYVFPDGELVAVGEAIDAARSSGFDVVDVQSLRAHYALTLAAWVARLEARWAEAVAAAGEEVARTWRLYMSAARLGFERGDLDVCQLLLAKPIAGAPATLPLRPWW